MSNGGRTQGLGWGQRSMGYGSSVCLNIQLFQLSDQYAICLPLLKALPSLFSLAAVTLFEEI